MQEQEVMDDIFTFLREHDLKPCVGAAYRFEDITEACIALDSGKVKGISRQGGYFHTVSIRIVIKNL